MLCRQLPPGTDPLFDYRVRDYPGFRRQLLDRMTELVPGFAEDDPVDFTTTLIVTAAYGADQLSYRLDWVGTEDRDKIFRGNALKVYPRMAKILS